MVEDDQSIFDLVRDRFIQWSFDVIGPEDFQKIIHTFIEEKPQLVIIDIQLPAFDGFHWYREIRQDNHLRRIRGKGY
ncbi:response regulator [Psychrobacillus sp. FJAT-51614]|uniref:response regulator n=1 Tax=Psychrobacillus mangrovi TaxID=3117745 RepID=UPI00301398DE